VLAATGGARYRPAMARRAGISSAPPSIEEREQKDVPPRRTAREAPERGRPAGTHTRPAAPAEQGRRGSLTRRSKSR
jgi:hypothetical protein